MQHQPSRARTYQMTLLPIMRTCLALGEDRQTWRQLVNHSVHSFLHSLLFMGISPKGRLYDTFSKMHLITSHSPYQHYAHLHGGLFYLFLLSTQTFCLALLKLLSVHPVNKWYWAAHPCGLTTKEESNLFTSQYPQSKLSLGNDGETFASRKLSLL